MGKSSPPCRRTTAALRSQQAAARLHNRRATRSRTQTNSPRPPRSRNSGTGLERPAWHHRSAPGWCHNARMRQHLGRASGCLICAAALLPAVIGVAAQTQDQPRPTFRTEANYVRVDVYPTRNDAPVTDLRREDFEILEDKVPQTIEQFDHIVIRGGSAQDARREPNTVAESRQAAADPRARVFVLFLDI